jgi:hypothetical protein
MKAEFCIFFSSVAEEIEQKGRDADPFLLEMGLSAIEGWQDYMLDPTLIVLRDEIWEAQEKLDSKQQTDNPVEKKTSTLCSLTSLKSSK